jgi:putative cell wall-binding protein
MTGKLRLVVMVVLAIALVPVMVAVPASAGVTQASKRGPVSAASLGTPGAVRVLGVDDEVPGISLDTYPISSRTVTGTLDAYPITDPPEDQYDVYSVYLAPGEQITLGLTGPVGDFNVYLLAPDTLSVKAPVRVQFSGNADSTENICYTASTLFGAGRYFVVVGTDNAEGEYALTWSVTGRSDGNIPGVRLDARSVTGTVDALNDVDDVYRVFVAPGQTLRVTATTDDPADSLRLAIFPPTWDNSGIIEPTRDVWFTTAPVTGLGSGSSVTLAVDVPPDPDNVNYAASEYYIDVYTDGMSGGYSLSWEALPGLSPGLPLLTSPIDGTLSARTVYSARLAVGDTLKASIDASSDAYIGARLYEPDGSVVWENTGFGDPKVMSYAVVAGGEGLYALEVTPITPGGCRIDWSIQRATARVQGTDRYLTAVQASRTAFKDGSDVVVLASGANFPDALSAAALAGAYDAPLLLVKPTSLPSAVVDELWRLGVTRCFVVGGESAVSAEVANSVEGYTGIVPVRIAGADRYATAAEVARRVVDRLGAEYDGGVFVARGDIFPDALAVSPLAWRSRRPVLLTKPAALPATTAQALDDIDATSALVVGDSNAVSEAVRSQVAVIAGSGERVSGTDRYSTSAAVARWGVASGIAGYRTIGLATGTNFPDALGGGIATGANGGVLLLTRPDALSGPTSTLISSEKGSIRWIRVFGSSKSVSNTVTRAVDLLLK